ncbi:hypothetical protein, partial [Microcoleus sp.]|uniref:hypothetical protein n=1 Tax=Microcoleus sp. TaxID=44472 RepID=UPI003525B5BB
RLSQCVDIYLVLPENLVIAKMGFSSAVWRYETEVLHSLSVYPAPTLPLARGGSKKFTNDLGLLYPDFWRIGSF